ncbi:MAG: DUF3048 domain-containing protein, partial [Anaerolineaceae bacterium]|nr:DUF3048 domain-containing protein [Anaerolineaceae bacterium]
MSLFSEMEVLLTKELGERLVALKKRLWFVFIGMALVLTACKTTAPADNGASVGTAAPQVETVGTATPREKTAPSSTPVDLGPPGYNRLTGLWVDDPAVLDRRPVLVKVENLPRKHRPQFGLSQADLVYEYYTELGSTRFAALYFGGEAEQVGPIRSARFFDIHLVRMYEAVFVFGSAYQDLLDALNATEFAKRLLVEQPGSCPTLCRNDPQGENFLLVNTLELNNYLRGLKINNRRQPLDGMAFSDALPPGGEDANQLFARFSGAIYNRWDYDPESGGYLRFSESQDDINYHNEVYEPLVDRKSGTQIKAENVVFVLAEYLTIVKTETMEVYDIDLNGSGTA